MADPYHFPGSAGLLRTPPTSRESLGQGRNRVRHHPQGGGGPATTCSLVARDTETSEPLGVPGELHRYPQPFHRALLEPLRRNLGGTSRPELNERA